MNKKRYKMMWILLLFLIVLLTGTVLFINQPAFGRLPKGERRERILNSPNYRDGRFQNLSETPQITSDKGFAHELFDFLFRKKERLTPETAIPIIKTGLWQLDRNEEVLIWLGHGSYFIQTEGKTNPGRSGFAYCLPYSLV